MKCTELNTANSDSSNPGYPFELLGDEPEDNRPSIIGRLFLWACGLVAFCLVVALLVPKS